MTDTPIVLSRKKSKINIGDPFGKLIVMENCGIIKRMTHFRCKCKCGNVSIVASGHLSSGHTKSCGCLKHEATTTHGMSKTPTYDVWEAIIQRCNNLKDKAYKNYGGRGITICKEWLDFRNFYKDMGEQPKDLTIERKNNDLGYFKENCCYATRTEQNRNRRINKSNKTGVSGVFWNKEREKYQVAIKANYKNHFIGRFNTLELATIARKSAELKYWGK